MFKEILGISSKTILIINIFFLHNLIYFLIYTWIVSIIYSFFQDDPLAKLPSFNVYNKNGLDLTLETSRGIRFHYNLPSNNMLFFFLLSLFPFFSFKQNRLSWPWSLYLEPTFCKMQCCLIWIRPIWARSGLWINDKDLIISKKNYTFFYFSSRTWREDPRVGVQASRDQHEAIVPQVLPGGDLTRQKLSINKKNVKQIHI